MALFFKKARPAADLDHELAEFGRVAGWTDALRFHNGQVEVGGWLLHPTRPMDSVDVALNGVKLAHVAVSMRPDVAAMRPGIPHAADSGFHVTAPEPPLNGALLTLAVEGSFKGQRVGIYRSFSLYPAATPEKPSMTPSAELLRRVSGTEDPVAFARMGIDAAGDLMSAADQYLGLKNVKALLDFGCGSGRVGYFLLKLWPHIDVSGCDIDEQAVTWCNENLRQGAFKTMAMTPPLPYADMRFDVVVAVSVMTHLELREQHRWLAEVRRVIRPGGLFLASIHGAFAAMSMPALIKRLAAKGILDQKLDSALDGVAPRGYYRATFQLPSFTRKAWSEHFEVLDIIQAGCGGYQDLVVMRRPVGA